MSSVGQAVGGIVGGAIGFFVGGPAGALKGAQIGIMAGGIIDPPPGPVINGPRLDDLSVQTSTYGAFIPRNYGTIAQTGNVFWLKGDSLTETAVSTESGGKGGPSTTTNTWEYSATFAVGLCEGPIDGVRRIWIGNQLWYDAGSDDLASVIASNETAAKFTLYLGTDTQLPDPLIQADKGAANVPAYRGLAYIVFDDLPLADYSNSLAGAQVKVEIVKDASILSKLMPVSVTQTGTDSRDISVHGINAMISGGVAESVINFTVANPEAPISIASFPAGGLVGRILSTATLTYVLTTSNRKFSVYDKSGSLLSAVTTMLTPTQFAVQDGYAYISGEFNPGKLQVFNFNNPYDPVYVGVANGPVASVWVTVSGDYAYVLGTGQWKMQIYDISNRSSAPVALGIVDVGDFPASVAVAGDYAFVVGEEDAVQVIDITDKNAPFVAASVACGTKCVDIKIVDKYAYVLCSTGTQGQRVQIFDISNPLSSTLVAQRLTTGIQPYALDVVDPLIYVVTAGGTLEVLLFAKNLVSPNSVPLSTVVEAECLTSNLLTAGDLDTTELTDQVRGYRIASQGAIRGGIDPLRAAWPFDVVQHGYQIKFKRRGSASVATIDASELDAREAGSDPGVQITNSRDMDTLLPRLLTLKYIDADREYDINEQPAQRGQ